MQRFGIGLAYHQTQRNVTCCQCGATWQERFVGIYHFHSDGRRTDAESHLCPRCIVAPLTVEFVMEQEIAIALNFSDTGDAAQLRKDTAARYEQFLANHRAPSAPTDGELLNTQDPPRAKHRERATVQPITLPVWTVVDLGILVKTGLPWAFVRRDGAVVMFTEKEQADAFIRGSKTEKDCVPRPIETSRELSW